VKAWASGRQAHLVWATNGSAFECCGLAAVFFYGGENISTREMLMAIPCRDGPCGGSLREWATITMNVLLVCRMGRMKNGLDEKKLKFYLFIIRDRYTSKYARELQ